jgi:hypothetical protein
MAGKPWRVQGSAVGAPGSRRMVATRDFLSGKLIRSPPEMTAPRTQPCARARVRVWGGGWVFTDSVRQNRCHGKKRILVDDWRTERIIAPFYATVSLARPSHRHPVTSPTRLSFRFPIIKYAEHPRSPDRAATLSIVTWSRRAKRRKRENVHGNGPRSRKTVQAIWSVGCMMVCAFHHPPSFTPDPRHRAGAGGWTSVADSGPGLAPLSFSEKSQYDPRLGFHFEGSVGANSNVRGTDVVETQAQAPSAASPLPNRSVYGWVPHLAFCTALHENENSVRTGPWRQGFGTNNTCTLTR